MIKTTMGKSIIIKAGKFTLERNCGSPGIVTLSHLGSSIAQLPGVGAEAIDFLNAYKKAIEEKIEYVESEYE